MFSFFYLLLAKAVSAHSFFYSFIFLPNLHQPSEKGTKRKILDRMKSHQIICGINEIFFFFSHAGGFGLVFKFVNWILPKCCMLFSQFQSLRVTDIDYWERYTGGKPWAGECRAGTFIMRLRTAAGNKKQTTVFEMLRKLKQGSTGVNRHGPVLQVSWLICLPLWADRWVLSTFWTHTLRHVQGFVKCYRSDWITHNSCSHRYLDEKLWCGDAPIWCLLLAWYWHRWISWRSAANCEDFF